MKDVLVKMFETKEVKVSNDGNKVNLVDIAKCCGLTKKGGSGTLIANWKSGNSNVVGKLSTILSGTNVPPQIEDEINNILIEIDEADDRNSIYVSSWLAKRLATECHSQTAMEFKNWLVTLDEARENGALIPNEKYITKKEVQILVEDVAGQITTTFAPIITEMQTQNSKLTELLLEQEKKREEEINSMKSLVGMKPKNTQVIGKALLSRERREYGKIIYGNSLTHIQNKTNLCTHFNVTALCNINIEKLDEVLRYVESMELVEYTTNHIYNKK